MCVCVCNYLHCIYLQVGVCNCLHYIYLQVGVSGCSCFSARWKGGSKTPHPQHQTTNPKPHNSPIRKGVLSIKNMQVHHQKTPKPPNPEGGVLSIKNMQVPPTPPNSPNLPPIRKRGSYLPEKGRAPIYYLKIINSLLIPKITRICHIYLVFPLFLLFN